MNKTPEPLGFGRRLTRKATLRLQQQYNLLSLIAGAAAFDCGAESVFAGFAKNKTAQIVLNPSEISCTDKKKTPENASFSGIFVWLLRYMKKAPRQ